NNAVTHFDVAIGSGGVFVYGTGGDVSGNTSVSPESFFVQDSAPTVSISVLDSVAAEPNNNGSFTITRSGGSGDFSQPLVVSYTVSGTATNGTDYTSLPLTITIPANATSVTLPITVIDDSSVEGAESVQINLVTSTTNPTSYVVDSAPNQASASLNISDNDGISYSVGVQSGADILTTRTITEGNTGSTPLSFVVTRSGDTSIASSISYAFSGSATNVSDYTIDNGLATSGTINFAANETSKTISVQILGDVAVESDETILLTLSNPQPSNVNPIITNATATLNLNNDDQPTANPQVNFDLTSFNTTEESGATTINLTVTLSGSPVDTITVPITVASNSNVSASDYALLTTTVTFAAGATGANLTQNVSITIQPDDLPEGAESLILNLGTPTGTADLGNATQATVTIDANDAIVYGVSTDQASVTEGNSGSKLVTFTVTRSGGVGVASTVDYSFAGTATNGADYTINGGGGVSGTLSFGVGELTKTITVNVLGDTTFESNETIVLNLSNPSSSVPVSQLTPDTITTTITNDDSPTIIEVSFGVANISQAEDATAVTISIPVTINGAPPNAVIVPIVINGVTTTAQSADYSLLTSSLTFAAGTTTLTQNVSLTIQPDNIPEDVENIVLGFGTITGGVASTTNPTIVTVSIPQNDSISYGIATSDVTIQEGNSGNKTVTFTVSRSGGTDVASSIGYTFSGSATNGSDYIIGNGLGTTGTVSFAPTETSKTITVNVSGDTTFESDETIIVSLSNPSATTPTSGISVNSASTTIANDDAMPLVTVNFAQTNLNATEELTANAIVIPVSISGSPLTDVIIPITISGTSTAQNLDYSLGTTSLTFAAGTTTLTQNVSLTITPDTFPEDIETIVLNFGTITGSGQAGVNSTSTVSIPANDAISYTLTGNSPTTITEGNSGSTPITFTVGRTGGIGVGSSVDYVVTGTATNGVDYNIVGNGNSTGTVVFAADETSKTITINVSGDVNYENNESIIVSLANPSVVAPPSNLNGVSPITTTITNDDTPPTVNFGVASLTQAELNGAVTVMIPVTLSDTPLDNVTVAITVQPSSLANSADYILNTATVSFTAGTNTLTQNVSVTIQPDDLPEGDETVVLGFGTITGSALQGSTNSSVITIPLNDAITYGVTANSSSINEGNSGTTPVTFTVTRSGGIGIASTVDYAITGSADSSDYSFGSSTNASGTVSFAVGETTKTLTVNVNGDTLFENDESIIVTLSAPSVTNPTSTIVTNTATTTITNDDPLPTVNFGTTSLTQTENATAVTITIPVTLSSSSINPVTVPITINGGSTAQGSDYTLGTTSVTFAAGTTTLTQNVSVTINPDNLPEGAETIILNFGTITGGTAGSANSSTITIPDNDAISYGITTSSTSITEGNSGTTAVTFTVTRSGGTDAASTVDYNFGGTAGAGDYTIANGLGTSGTVSFAPTETSKTITVNVNGETLVENDESISVTLSNPSASTPTSTITNATVTTNIINDDSFSYSVNSAVGITEGNSGTTALTFTVNRTGTGLPSSINYTIGGTATSGSDFNNISGTSGATGLQGTINFAANETSKTITLDVIGDTNIEPDETVTVTLSSASATNPASTITTATATFVIFNDDQPVANFGNTTITQTEDAAAVIITIPVSISGVPLSDITIPITVSGSSTAQGSDYSLGTTSVTFAANTTTLTQNVSVTINPDDIPEGNETVILNFGTIIGGTAGSANSSTITIPANDAITYGITTSNASISEGNSGTTPVTFTVSRSGGIGVASTVDYAFSGTAGAGDYTIGNGLGTSGTLSFAANETSKTVTVNVTGDTVIESNEDVILTISNPSASTPSSIIATASALTTISNDDSPPVISVNFGTANTTQTEDVNAVTITIPVSISGTPSSDVTIPITVSGSSTAQDSDYTLGTTSVTFAANTTTLTQNVSVTINPDDIPEGSETVILNFGTITGGTAGSANSSTITIPANDPITYGITTSSASVSEGNSGTTPVTFTVTRSGGIGVASTVDYAFSGTAGAGDYNIANGLGTSGTLSFAANETSKTVTVNVIGDTVIENNEDIVLTISNPSASTPSSIIATASALTTISNDDSPPV
ncbi:MAG: Calx-beta domain-containing protein, partial [Pseudanabaenaceae cyanobacterium]